MSTQQRSLNSLTDRNITYSEVNLPFDELEKDYLEAEELYDALTSQTMDNTLNDYSISPDASESCYTVTACKELPRHSEAYIDVEINPEKPYSHLLVRLESESAHQLEGLERDLERVESGLESYFKPKLSTTRSSPGAYGYTD